MGGDLEKSNRMSQQWEDRVGEERRESQERRATRSAAPAGRGRPFSHRLVPYHRGTERRQQRCARHNTALESSRGPILRHRRAPSRTNTQFSKFFTFFSQRGKRSLSSSRAHFPRWVTLPGTQQLSCAVQYVPLSVHDIHHI